MIRFGLIANYRKPELWDLVPRLVDWLLERDVPVAITDRLVGPAYQPPEAVKVYPASTIVKHVDIVLSIGGDGTILSTARIIGKAKVPILGIHMGGLGFLAEVPAADCFKAMEQVIEDHYRLEERMVLAVDVQHGGKIQTYYAINDMVVDRGSSPRLLHTQLEVSGRKLNDYVADGLIVATPTGSTAYSLSAGGPIVVPTLEALTITPISPHSLAARSIVIPSTDKIVVRFDQDQEGMALMLDGQVKIEIDSSAVITARRASWNIQMVKLPGSDYYKVLRTKLGWSGEAKGMQG
ncbi:MAG: NAD(+)/NADH kinase [Candidatus Marinimicrobia bacterium]|nr:NAD(+)/NADH kinase [Candidatus Neomarinimicrobiota bacterium]